MTNLMIIIRLFLLKESCRFTQEELLFCDVTTLAAKNGVRHTDRQYGPFLLVIMTQGITKDDIYRILLWYVNSLSGTMFLVRQPPVGHGLLIHEVSGSHTTTHHSR